MHHFIWFVLLSGFHSIAKGALKSFWAPFDKRPGSLWIFHSPAPNTLQMLIMKIRFWIEFISFKGASGWHFLFQYWTRRLSCLYNLNNMLWAFFNRPIYIILHTVQILKLNYIAYLYTRNASDFIPVVIERKPTTLLSYPQPGNNMYKRK